VLMVACSSDDDSDSPSTAASGPTTTTAPTAAPSPSTPSVPTDSDRSIVAMLGQLPASLADGDELVQIAYTDLDAATELSGLERPDSPSDTDALVDWAQGLTVIVPTDGEPAMAAILPEAVNPSMVLKADEFRDEVGWSLLDIGAFIEFQQPPQVFTVIDGDIDPADIDAAAGAATDDIWSVGDGDDFEQDIAALTPARPLGAPLRMAQHDGLLAVSRSTPPVKAWLADEPSLADDSALTAVAGQLDDADAYAAYLVDADPSTHSNPFDALGLGVALDGDGPLGLFVYHYADEAAATDAAAAVTALFEGRSDRTQAPWSDVFSSWDVAAAGDVVVARVRFADERPPNVLWQILFTRDNLTA
jgi:hypothetical protein